MLLCFLYAQWHSSCGMTAHAVVLLGLGTMVAGPDANFGGAATINAVERSGNKEFVSVASGFVNSMGSVGTVFTGMLVAAVKGEGNGWASLWNVLAVLSGLPCIILLPAILAEHRHLVLYRDGH